jgi:membrane-bound metal-dependent hydrolase YbcI (DUF457 family)
MTPEMPSSRRLRSSSYEVPGSAVAFSVGLILATDQAMPESGRPIWLVGALDELAHLATGIVALGTLGPVVDGSLARGLIGASVLLDVDHIPQYAGANWLTQSRTARPYPHSLATLIAATAAFGALRRRAPHSDPTAAALGVVLGLSAHFLRDLGAPATGVPLLWPFDNHAFSISYGHYVAALTAGLAWALGVRARKRRTSGTGALNGARVRHFNRRFWSRRPLPIVGGWRCGRPTLAGDL